MQKWNSKVRQELKIKFNKHQFSTNQNNLNNNNIKNLKRLFNLKHPKIKLLGSNSRIIKILQILMLRSQLSLQLQGNKLQ